MELYHTSLCRRDIISYSLSQLRIVPDLCDGLMNSIGHIV